MTTLQLIRWDRSTIALQTPIVYVIWNWVVVDKERELHLTSVG